jgi:hypothetical protein
MPSSTNIYYHDEKPTGNTSYTRNNVDIMNLIEVMHKKILTENKILQAYNNGDRLTIFIESIKEYRRRYKISEIKKIEKSTLLRPSYERTLKYNLNKINYFIRTLEGLKYNSEKNIKLTKVIDNFKKTVNNSLTLPYFINDSFKTRKTVAHYVRNSNIKINAKNNNLRTNINELKSNNGIRFKFEENIVTIESESELMEKLGINKIRRLQTYENIENHPNINREDEIYRNEIFNLLLQYFIRTDEIIDPEYNIHETNSNLTEYHPKVQESALKLRNKNNILLKITKQLLLLNSKIGIYPSNSIRHIANGGFGKVYLIDSNIYKYEHIRFKKISNNFLQGRNIVKTQTKKVPYLYNNYVPSTILFGVLIQQFLFNINPLYVSEILNFSICYEKDIALTVMKQAFIGKNDTLLDFIINEIDRPTYIIDLINIIIELCKILEIYQNRCCFVHHDLHPDNIIINYQYSEDGMLDFNLKIIDISSVSSIIFKYKGEYLIFKQLDIWYAKTHESINPFLSFMWNKYDLFFLIIWILFSEERKSVNKKIPIEHENFKKFIKLLLKNFNIVDNYKNILNTTEIRDHKYHSGINPIRIKFYSIISAKSERDKLFKLKNKDIYKMFIPSFLKEYLENIKIEDKYKSLYYT